MKKVAILSSLLAVCFVLAVQAQTSTPKSGPEWKQWHGVLGHWTYTCDYQATPLGPASTSTGEYNNTMILGGFFMKGQWKEKGPNGEMEGIETIRYNAENKDFAFSGYMNDGTTYSGTATLNGTTERQEGKFFIAGKEYPSRATITWANDWTTADWKSEVSTDGKTFVPWFEQKMTKVKPETKTK
jgi:Protein of unknown function (DUF1579)